MSPWTITILCIVAAIAACFAAVARGALARRIRIQSDQRARSQLVQHAVPPPAREHFGLRKSPPPRAHIRPVQTMDGAMRFSRTSLEEINLRRQRERRPMMSPRGFQKAIIESRSAATPPSTVSDWITWFVLYDAIFSSDTTRIPHECPGFTMQPAGGDGQIRIEGDDNTFRGMGVIGPDTPLPVSPPEPDIYKTLADSFRASAEPVQAASVADSPTYQPDPPAASDPTPASADVTPSYSAPDTSFSAPDTSSAPDFSGS